MPGITGMGGGPTGLGLVGGGALFSVNSWGARGFSMGSFWESGSTQTWDHIDYIDIANDGGGTDFGNLTRDKAQRGGSVSNEARIAQPGGYYRSGGNSTATQPIDYVNPASTGNASDFGDLLATASGPSSHGCDGRGVIASSNSDNVIQYITIETTGNATDFGDRTITCNSSATGGNGVVVVWMGGHNGGYGNTTIDYVTGATTGNASDFGDLTLGRDSHSGASSDLNGSDRMLAFHGIAGGNHNDTIDYVTMSTTGNATDFGNGTASYTSNGGASNNSRGIIMGGGTGGYTTAYNYIRKVTIDTTGNASNMSTLQTGRRNTSGSSGAAS